MDKHFVLDSFVIITLLNKEPSAKRLVDLLHQATNREVQLTMSLVNLGEVVYDVTRRLGEEQARIILAHLETLPVTYVEAGH